MPHLSHITLPSSRWNDATVRARVERWLEDEVEPAKARRGAPPRFQCRYAPHFGMFEAHAGKDLTAQLEFMADQGFTALEDNGLMARPIEVQTRIGETLAKRGMTMGVFVID